MFYDTQEEFEEDSKKRAIQGYKLLYNNILPEIEDFYNLVLYTKAYCKPNDNEEIKPIKLKCDHNDCNAEFIIILKDGESPREYYICPECEAMVWT